MMMDIPVNVNANDRIQGTITISRNKHWRRHLRVYISFYHISVTTKSEVSSLEREREREEREREREGIFIIVTIITLYLVVSRSTERSSNYGDDTKRVYFVVLKL